MSSTSTEQSVIDAVCVKFNETVQRFCEKVSSVHKVDMSELLSIWKATSLEKSKTKEKSDKPICTGKKKDGNNCTLAASEGSDKCHRHGGSTKTKKPAKKKSEKKKAKKAETESDASDSD